MSSKTSIPASENAVLKLGSAKFSVATAAYAELQRSCEWQWPEQQRIGNTPALQFTGTGCDTITLPCVIYPGQAGDAKMLAELHKLANAKIAHHLVDGTGNNLGTWVIKSISETFSAFLKDGVARKIEFSLTIARYQTPAQIAAAQSIAATRGIVMTAYASGGVTLRR